MTLAAVAVALVVVVLALSHRLSIFWLALPAAAIAAFAVRNEHVLQTMRLRARGIAFYENGLARLDHRWAGRGETGDRFLHPSHPYARDLDLFGRGSLFELLSTARTRAGEETLARWLLDAAAPDEVLRRQAAVEELRHRLDLREDLAVLGEDLRTGVRPELLTAWGNGAPQPQTTAVRAGFALLAMLWIASLAVWGMWGFLSVALAVTVINIAVGHRFRAYVDRVVPPVEAACEDLALLASVLARLEGESFRAPKLVELRAGLNTAGLNTDSWPPSRAIARLNRLTQTLNSREHLLLRIVDPMIFWTLQAAFAVEGWRSRFGAAVPGWLAAVGELEALLSLAGYAAEHPDDAFPEFTSDAPWFEAEGLGHPLLPEQTAVRNDITLGPVTRLLIISGLNMAGKSTFVRAVGANAVLAQCGAPVRARRLRLSRLAVAASVCVLDSLQGGISHFYAEILRLKQIADLAAGPAPLLFLLDELLQGTNSHDRRAGAAAVLRRLVEAGAMGLVTTHDLALTEIAATLGARATNVHFEDRLDAGKLQFDYTLKPGVVQTSNALELMRSVGLDV